MKTLYILRHAKSSWSDPNLDDHDRPLNARGERDKLVMAKFINSHFKDIEVIFTSSATRALDYAVSIHKFTGVPINLEQALYTFSAKDLLSLIADLPQSYDHIALVAHNPAATEVVNHLSDLGADEKLVNLPTAAIVKIEFEQSLWSDLSPKITASPRGRVADFAKPKALDDFEDDLD